ncbi:MAG: alpha/beta hydrolase [Actinomycetota bacterium]|nr:alpha/beta hydrolase [Actinomycetota bacterium]
MPLADLGDVQLHYRASGNDSAPPVLGIMGFASDQRLFAGQIGVVTETHRFITFDNRGVGRSSPGAATTIDEMANDALRLLDNLEIDRTVVFGVSMGGAIAQRLTLDHPDRVSALVLAVTFARPIEFMRRQHALTRAVIEAGAGDAVFEGSLIRMFTPRFFEIGRDAVDRLVDAVLSDNYADPTPTEVLLAHLEAIDKHDALSELGKITCPTLVVGGRFDVMVPGFASEEIAAAIPGSHLEMPEGGHGLMLEEADTFNKILGAFLTSQL